MDFMAVSSYGDSTRSSGIVKIDKDLSESIQNQHVLIVEDIIDSGLTLSYIQKILQDRNPASIKICVLCNKPSNLQQHVKVDYCGFLLEDEFVVGYGLDFKGYLRNLPYIGVVKAEYR
jgi:hypoxanthine phosphoribosyltransferase